jgi:hypothetical protein
MLPRAEAPATRLAYTTADMSERLAKKKAEQANQALRFGVTNPPEPEPEPKKSGGGWLSQVGNMAKSLVLTPAGTLADMVPGVAMLPGVKGEGVWGYEPEDAGTTNFFQAGGQALEQSTRRAVGDFTALPFIGKPSASPTATDIKQQGWVNGLGNAALDYGNLAATAAPFVGPAAKGIQGIRGANVATEIPYRYGMHVSPVADLAEIQARKAMQNQYMAGDSMTGSSYMWDAKSPQGISQIFDNWQLNPELADFLMTPEELAYHTPNIYLTRAPANTVFQDANVLNSPSLRVAGNQEVITQLPRDRAALQAVLEKYGITQRSAQADKLESKFRGMNPQVRRDVINRPRQMAEEQLRITISRGFMPGTETYYPGIYKLDPNAPLEELLRDPSAQKLFDNMVNR